MKVLCIDDATRPNEIPGSGFNVKEGCVYTVVADGVGAITGTPIYCLAEDPDHETMGFAKDRFIPLSDIDETQMERNYETKTQTA